MTIGNLQTILKLFFLMLVLTPVSTDITLAQNYNISSLNHQLALNHNTQETYNANNYVQLISHEIQNVLSETVNSNFNLNSIGESIKASSIENFHALTLNLNGENKFIQPVTFLTPAEAIAVREVLNNNTQTLILNDNGQAIGGSFSLNNVSNINNLIIPHNVTLTDNNDNLYISGNLINYGNIFVELTHQSQDNSAITTGNLINMVNANIDLKANTNNTESLSINTDNNLINLGSISSFYNLTLNSHADLVNFGNSNILAGNVVTVNLNSDNYLLNNGTLAGQNININFSDDTVSQNSNIITGFGNFSASGNIDIDNYDSKGNLDIIGLNFISDSLNINGPTSNVIIDVNSISGIVNVDASTLSTQVSADNLNLGNITATGDPSFFNVDGSVNISANINVPGNNVAIIANTDINITGGSITTGSAGGGGNAGEVRLIAGANFTSNLKQSGEVDNDYSSLLTIYGPSATGGQINLGGCTGIFANVTNPYNYPSLYGNGALVKMIAWAGTEAGSGTINVPASCPIETGGLGTGSNGDVILIAGATGGTSITVGNISTQGGSGGGGNIALYTATPEITNTGSGQVIIQGGSNTSNSAGFTYGTIQASSINITGSAFNSGGGSITIESGGIINAPNTVFNSSGVGGLSTTDANGGNGGNAGNISLIAGGNISINGLIASGGGGAGGWSGGDSSGTQSQTNGYNGGNGGNGGTINVISLSGSFYAQSYISASGGGGGGGGGGAGEIIIQYSGQTSPPPGSGGTGGIGGQAGTVTISVGSGIYLNQAIELGQGANGGNGGNSSSIFYGGGGGGGGASGGLIGYGGGGGGGGYGGQYSGSGGGGGGSAAGYGGGGGGGGNINATNGGGGGGSITTGGSGGYNGGATTNGTLGSSGTQGAGGNGGTYGIPIGYGGSFSNDLIIGGGGGSSASSAAQSGQNGGTLNLITQAQGAITLNANVIDMNGSGSSSLVLSTNNTTNPSNFNLNGFIDATSAVTITSNMAGSIYSGYGVELASSSITINSSSATIGQGSSNPLTIASANGGNINLSITGTGAVYLDSLNQVSLTQINDHNTFSLTSSGAILVQSVINSSTIALATSANNTGIYIGSSIGSPSSNIFLTASGNSQIFDIAGTVTANSLYLAGGSSSLIGSTSSFLTINANSLTVNSGGSVNVDNYSSNLDVNSSNVA